MSDIRTRAVAEIDVNGNAGQQLQKLKQRADDFRDAIAKAYKEGNDKLANKLTKDLKATNREIRTMQNDMVNVEQTLKRLDKATPKELRETLRRLEKDLKNIERGSKAWDEQTKKIRTVRSELDKVNKEMREHDSIIGRLNSTINKWGMSIASAVAAFTGLTMAGRQAVQAYAEMDQEMANVRKFTGMTAEQVAALNEEFKKMDTRTSREDLNKLAQEAGRLGMQSQEDVMGFVRAADKINVALDDLGEGATLTLSKLTTIFGDRERLGVEQSLLSVGSVINELSQNCTASAPYLAEFASRLGGVGAQAGMTTQQIMGIGAVLDTYNQKVEASATALSQVIVRLYQDPAKYAKVAGLDVKAFADLLKQDANAALIQFLEALNKAGGMDVLSPMFKDMGENGARAIQALSTLATHIDEVKSQQQVANQAFDEAISIDKEFNVQNNTVQAGLEKAKKNFNEMAVALGEKLAPAMRYAITGSSAMMRVLAVTVDFIIKYKGAIITVTAAIVAYKVAVHAANMIDNVHYALLVTKDALMKAHKVTVLLCSVAYNKLTGNITRATAAQKLLNATMKMNPWGLAAAAITAVVVGLIAFAKRTREATKAQKEMAEMDKELAKARQDHMEKLDAEKGKINQLVAVARDETVSMEKRQKAIDILNAKIPGYCASLDAETGKYRENKRALDDYLLSLEKKIRLEANREEYERLIREDEKLKREIYEAEDAERERVGWSTKGQSRQNKEAVAHAYGYSTNAQGEITVMPGIAYDKKQKRKLLKQRIDKLMEYSKNEDLVIVDATEDGGGGGSGYTPSGSGSGSGGSHGSHAKPDKFAAEKAWREREIALNKIAWLTGKRDYEEYTDMMLEIESQYHAKRLLHTDLTGNEEVQIKAEYLEALKKQQEQYDKWTIEEENQAYADLKRQIQDDYLQKRISTESYNMQMENVEMAHMRALALITKEGTEERAKAETAYRERLVADQLKRQQEFEQKEKEHQKKLEDAWEEYAVSQEEKRARIIKETEALLEAAYKSKLALIEMDESLSPDQKASKISQLTSQYENALKKLHEPVKEMGQELGNSLEDWIGRLMDKIFGEGTWSKYGEGIKAMYSTVAATFSALGQLADAENELRLARLQKYYEREISMAEGNAYKVKQIERKKQKDEAKLKAEASKRQFAQQVISAVAETALAAINAYASASKVSWILGPIAAAMAVAAGGIQIAAIKKQQAASLATGYSKGGFTPAGAVDEPVGVVHAGEWVASQKLLKNPQTRAAIDALDAAQRNNTIGRLGAADVSRTVTAPSVLAGAAADGSMERTMVAMVAVMSRYGDTMARLGDRLDEPFVTVNTVTGDTGIKQAQDEYQRLQNNTLPKSKRR